MPSIKQLSASLSSVSCASVTPAGDAIPVTIVLRWSDGEPAVGIPASEVVLTSSGASNTLVQPSGVTNALGVIAGATYAGATAGARTLTVTVADLALDDQPVVTVDGVAGVSFFTEWTRSSTGLTDAEFLDGTKWDGVQGGNSGPAAEIVDSDAGLTTRGDYFRINNTGSNSRQIRKDEMYPASTSHWGRVYARTNNTTSRHNHFISIGGLSGNPIEFAWGFLGEAGGSVPFVTGANETDGSTNNYPYARWWAGDVDNVNANDPLAVGDWFLLEWHIEFLTSTAYNVEVWVSAVNSSGVITTPDKWTASNFYQSDAPGTGQNLATGQTVLDIFGLSSSSNPTNARRYLLGNEGPAGGTTDAGYFDLASFAISLDGRLRDADVSP